MASVPSPGIFNAAVSPHISIYDQEKSERWGNCHMNQLPPNSCSDSSVSDEMYVLDDKLEDSTLQNMLTSEVMSSLRASSTPADCDFQWSGKSYTSVPVTTSNDSIESTPTLSELNMETDLSIVSDLLNLDPEDNSSLDLICNNNSASYLRYKNLSAAKSAPDLTPLERHIKSDKDSNIDTSQKRLMDISGSKFVKNYQPFVDNFPPRSSNPPVVGVVAPVKKELIESETLQSPCLQNLLKQPTTLIKSEFKKFNACSNEVKTHKGEPAAQIVPPSQNTVKRSFDGTFKVEPSSPGSAPIVINEESLEERWKDIENFIHEADDPMFQKKKRKRYDSGGSEQTSDDNDDYLGENEGDDSEDEYSDIDDDITHIKPSECESLVTTGKKQKQFFWQYNVQSKGPKGTRLKLAIESPSDPHVLNDFEDPVFDECNTSVAGIRHGGKARKGDGNEISPNPKKLFMIGHQLLRLNRQINACQLGPDVPATKRNESRKEKNKLASRACRLKKKAQHEANKIKLYGLEQEHSQLNEVIRFVVPLLREKAKLRLSQIGKSTPFMSQSSHESLHKKLDNFSSEKLKCDIAGKTADYVNRVILNVESGDPSGGLEIRRKRKS